MKIIPTPKLSTKVAAGLDIAATLFVEHLGMSLKLPAWHPVIVFTVGALTFALFKWKNEITVTLVNSLPWQNKNSYRFDSPKYLDAIKLESVKERAKKARKAFDIRVAG